MNSNEGNFDVSRAELFDALGHHTRIAILQALEGGPMGFAELKKATDINSSGLLSFHLGKLTHLVSQNQEGAYELTDQGREAVGMIRITRSTGGPEERVIKVRAPSRKPYLIVIAVLLAGMVALGSFVAYQQIGVADSHGLIYVRGVVVGAGNGNWVAGITPISHSSRIVFTSPSGNSTTTVPNPLGEYWATLSAGVKYSVTVYWNASLSCSSSCMSIIDSSGSNGINYSAYSANNQCLPANCSSPPPGLSYVTSVTGSITMEFPNSTSAVAEGTCTGNVLDLSSSSMLLTYNPLPC